MRILSLQAENVKRLKAVHIKPDGSLVVVGGDNDNGKTSVLDSIMYALSGSAIPAKALRNGENKGAVTLDLGEYIVTRKFNRKGDDVNSSLEIKSKEGAKQSSPQKILDDLCGRLAFDPVEFLRLKPKQQLEALKELVNLDFTQIDKEREAAFAKRTEINRQCKAKDAELAACPSVQAPEREVSVSMLTDELAQAEAVNKANEAVRRKKVDAQNQFIANCAERADIERQIAALEARLQMKTEIGDSLANTVAELDTKVAELKDVDTAQIREEIKNVETVNRAVRQNEKHAKLQAECEELAAHASSLTEAIDALDQKKRDALSKAAFPVAGLGFDENGVTFNGLPFDKEYQSSANMIRVAVGMGTALNPRLKVMLIRDGSLLDSKSLSLVAEMAAENDLQVWMERVGAGPECSVIIEDGEVREPALATC